MWKILRRFLKPGSFVSFRVGARFDCGGKYSIGLHLLNENGIILISAAADGVHQSGDEWIDASCTLNILQQYQALYLWVIIRGKDNQYWAGQYGPKFARISVLVKFLSIDDVDSVQQ